MAERGPVSKALEHEITNEVRRQGIVVWLDRDQSYTSFTDDLAARHARGEFPYPVVGFRGSFLELLFQLEPFGSNLEKSLVLVHMPSFNEETIRATPALELYEMGVRFRKALDTLIREAATGRVTPDDVESFLAGKPTLEQADQWLSNAVVGQTFGLAAALAEVGASMLAEALAEPDSALALRAKGPEEVSAVEAYLHKLTGMDEAWISFYDSGARAKAIDRVLSAFGAWILCVEYVHDLRRPPHLTPLKRLRDLSPPLVKACCDLTTQLRRERGDAYVRIADEVGGMLEQELAAMSPEDLGQIDTFREEEARVLEGAVEALRKENWAVAKAWCDARHGERSFWLARDQQRRWAWNLVEVAASFGETLTRAARPLEGARSLEDAAERYASTAAHVDRAHRRFEERRYALLESRLPHYGALREVATLLRSTHRRWCDQLTRDFSALCKEHGFLPPPSLQQRTLFEEVVHPLTQSDDDKVALFVIDAFRFEMAMDLVGELGGGGAVVTLKPRFAELPTITAVGMNALAPVANGGRLHVAGSFEGFKTGELTVKKPDDRARAMGMRSAGKPALLLKLTDVCDASTSDLERKIRGHKLIIVHSREIDDAGEANVGLPTFESTLRQIKAAFHHLQRAGIKSCVLTADHGFLLQDETTKREPFDTSSEAHTRYAIRDYPVVEKNGFMSVSLSSLGYDGIAGHLVLRSDTAVSAAGATFVHGGNSLEERIIPVLTVTRKRAEQGGYSEYAIEVERADGVMGLHRFKVRIGFAKHTITSLGFAAPRAVGIALRVPGRPDLRVVIKDVSGAGALRAGELHVPIGEAWTEVFFSLEGPRDERVKVEVHYPDNIEKIAGATLEPWYLVSGTARARESEKPEKPEKPQELPSWEDAFADEAVRKVFLHIDRHGAMTEEEMVGILGSARAFRRFSLEFEDHLAKLPFRVRIEAGEGGKRYVREGDR